MLMNLVSFFLLFVTSPPSSLTVVAGEGGCWGAQRSVPTGSPTEHSVGDKHSLIAVTWCEVQKRNWLNRYSIFYGVLFCPFSFYIIGKSSQTI